MCGAFATLAREGAPVYRWLMRTWLLLLAAALPCRAAAQSIAVVGAPGFRARPVHQRQLAFTVAVDTAAGGLVLRDLAIGAFTFTGSVRLDAVAPFARAPEPAGYADSARFERDGRVILEIADSAARGPIEFEPRGAAGVNGARLLMRAHGWPMNRVLVVTIDPFDLYVTATRAGYATRDPVRVDTEHGVVFLSDTAASPAVVAVAMGRGAHGRIQADASTILVDRNYDGVIAHERRAVSRLTLFIEPDRSDSGEMHAEVDVGLGRSESEALAAAQGGDASVPAAALLPRITTPAPEVTLALAQLAGAAAWVDATPAAPPPDTATGPALWREIAPVAQAIVTRDYGRPDSAATAFARLRGLVVRELFGVWQDSDQVNIAPRLDGVADDFTWQLDNWRFDNDSLRLSYRPADRRAEILVGALYRVRLHVAFPWLGPTSCVIAQRGSEPPEHLMLVALRDGTAYVDIRGAFDPARITLAASGCGP